MKNLLLFLGISIFLFSCQGKPKTTEKYKKKNYVRSVNSSYDSTTGNYKTATPIDSIEFIMGYIIPGSLSFIVWNETMLMKDSLLKATTGQKLSFGDSVLIEHSANTEYHHNFPDWIEPVYKVKVIKQGKEYSGHLTQNVIAIAAKRLKDRNVLLIQLSELVEVEEEKRYIFYGEVIVTDSTYRVLDKKRIRMIGGESSYGGTGRYNYSIETALLPATGIDGAVDLINLNIFYPACGYAGGDILLVWDGAKLHYAFEDYDASDAGVYSVSSNTILPGDKGGKKNTFFSITNSVSYEYDENDKYNELEHDSLVLQYSWEKGEGIVKTDTLFSGKK